MAPPQRGGRGAHLGGHVAGEAEVAELDRAARPDQDVLRLHVAVDDAVVVQVVQRLDELPRDLLHLLLRQRLVVLEDLEELALRELRHEHDVRRRLEVVQHADDVRVVEGALDPDLGAQLLQVLVALAVLLDELERDGLAGEALPPLVDLAERPLPAHLQHVVVLHRHRC